MWLQFPHVGSYVAPFPSLLCADLTTGSNHGFGVTQIWYERPNVLSYH